MSEYDAVHDTKTAEKYASTKRLRADEDPGFADFIAQNSDVLVCSQCGSIRTYKHDIVARKARYRCRDCGGTFSPFKDTLVQGSSWTWDQWVDFIHCTLMGYSLVDIQHHFAEDHGLYLSDGTVLTYRHKVMHAITLCFDMPKLSDVVQVDETYFREGISTC